LKNATIIYNPIAGRQPHQRETQVREAAAALAKQGFAATLVPTTGPDTARDLARAAATQNMDLIVVCGGDGTINEVINGIAPGNTRLAILPGGTANIMAKELGLPRDLVTAARQLGDWSPRRIALGLATWSKEGGTPTRRRFFLSLAGIGFDAYVVHKLPLDFKKSWGVLAYVWTAVHQALRYPFPTFTCRADERDLRACFAVVQRTTRYAGWLHVAPGANVFEPEFRLCAFKSRNRLRYFLYAPAVILRQHLRFTDVELVRTNKVVCEPESSEGRIHFELDGELVGLLPATFEIVQDALTLLVPESKAVVRG
jgi:YegS/Rv2252/BmrU family lipid kinase